MREYMARLGEFAFSIDTAAFQEMERISGYKWASVERIGRAPGLQYTGEESEKITLSGVIYPTFRGGLGQIEALRQQAGTKKPLPFIYSSEQAGQYLGQWCIEQIRETRRIFFSNGAPKKIEFSLSLVKYGEDTKR